MGRGVERLLRAADRFQQRHRLLAIPVGVVRKFGDDQAGKHAALLAYYGFLSLFPTLLLLATVLGLVLARRLWPRSLLQPPLTEPDRRVLAALAETERRRPEETVEVRFSTDADG